MAARPLDPMRLDVEAFAAEGTELGGRWPLSGFRRIVESIPPDAPLADGDEIRWHARGERIARPGGAPETWLDLDADGAVWLQCQRCLGPVRVPLAVRRRFRFVHGEDAAAELDASSEDDVLASSRAFDLHQLTEDELLLALPLVPLHDICPEPLRAPAAEAFEEEKANPFAALAALKRGGPVN
jgi:uncharacterized protein